MVDVNLETFKTLPADKQREAMFESLVDIDKRVASLEKGRDMKTGTIGIWLVIAGIIGSGLTFAGRWITGD